MSETNASSRGLRVVVRKNRLMSMTSTSSDSSTDDVPPLIKRKRARSPPVDDHDTIVQIHHEKTPDNNEKQQAEIIQAATSGAKRHRSSRGSTRSSSSVNINDLIEALNSKQTSKPLFSSHQMLNALPEFDPENKSQNIEIWLHKVNEYACIYNWDDRQTSHYATQKLTGTAKKWFYSLPSLDFAWSEWQVKLRRAFPIDDNFALILEEMFSRKTKAEESLRTYFYDKLMLLNRCGITGKKAVDCLIHGITDVSMRNSAQALKCTEPEDLLQYFVIQQPESKVFSLTQKKRGYTEGMENKMFRKIRCYNCGVEGHTSNRCFQMRKEKQIRTSLMCFNCNEEGHRYVDCPKTVKKCNVCKKIGHDDQNCRFSSSSKDRMNKEKTVLNIDSSHTNQKFNKDVEINNKSLIGYIDFGSDCSLIKYTEAEKLKLDKNFSDLPVIRGFGNSYVSPLYKSKVVVRIDEVDANIVVHAVPDRYLNVSMLIGQNFTEMPNVTVLKDNNKLTFYNKPIIDTDLDLHTIKLINSSDVVLNGIHVIPVHCAETYTGDVYVEAQMRPVPGKEYRVLQGAYSFKDGKGDILVSNASCVPLTLKQGIVVSRALPFKEVDMVNVQRIQRCAERDLPPLNRNDIQVGPNVNNKTFDTLYDLLQNYRDCFATSMNEIGCAPEEYEMKIELKDDKPIVYRPYRLSHSERAKVREMISELLDNEIIRESSSDYASPILMVKKKTGEQRLCVDFRALNAKTIKNRYPLPIIDDQVANLSGNKFFTTLDMASGYYQVPLSEDSKHLTAFVTPDGQYEFNRMPFGLANAPAVFQKLVNKMLGSSRYDSVLAYMDDLLIPTKTIDDGFEKLEQVLKLIREYGLTLKLSKCHFFSTTIDYLGYEVSAEGIKPSKLKTVAIEQFPTPTNIHETRQFLGLAGYFRKFVKGFGEIARPLTSLLKKEVEWKWTEIQAKAFTALKEVLCSRPVLALYNPKFRTELHTDASSQGIGGILLQWQENSNELKPVAYFSRQTSSEEKVYHSYELETLAVVCSLRKFRTYLLGMTFKIFTDCQALRLTLSKKDLMPRIARWLLQMEEYDYEIEYRPGERMAHVDALSRNPTECPNDDCAPENVISVLHIEQNDWLVTLQLGDPEVSQIIKILKPDLDEGYKDIKKHYVFKNNVLYRKIEGDSNNLRLVIPKGARWQICRLNHDEIGHFGVKKTLERIQSQYWFSKMSRFVKKYVGACLECAYNKDSNSSKQGHIYPIEKVSVPFQTIHIDHLGPFVKSKRQNAYILTVVDGFSKYVFVRPVKDTKSSTAIKVLENIFQDFGSPERIISDRGSAFTSGQFKQFCADRNIKHVLNAVSCPRANGQAERFNQTILNALATQNSDKNEKEWDLAVPKVQFGINNTVNATTGKTASEVLFGVRLKGDSDSMFREVLEDSDNKNRDISELRKEVKNKIDDKQKKMKELHDSKVKPANKYNINDLVKITKVSFAENPGQSKKLLPKFIGPYKVSKVLGNDRYEITNVPGLSKSKKYCSVVSADRMRQWINVNALNVMSDDNSSESDSY